MTMIEDKGSFMHVIRQEKKLRDQEQDGMTR